MYPLKDRKHVLKCDSFVLLGQFKTRQKHRLEYQLNFMSLLWFTVLETLPLHRSWPWFCPEQNSAEVPPYLPATQSHLSPQCSPHAPPSFGHSAPSVHLILQHCSKTTEVVHQCNQTPQRFPGRSSIMTSAVTWMRGDQLKKRSCPGLLRHVMKPSVCRPTAFLIISDFCHPNVFTEVYSAAHSMALKCFLRLSYSHLCISQNKAISSGRISDRKPHLHKWTCQKVWVGMHNMVFLQPDK